MAAQPVYSMVIDWSVEDQAYIVTVPDLPGCRTHGATYEEAARNGHEVIDLWIEAHEAQGLPLPHPLFRIGSYLNPVISIDSEEWEAAERDLASTRSDPPPATARTA